MTSISIREVTIELRFHIHFRTSPRMDRRFVSAPRKAYTMCGGIRNKYVPKPHVSSIPSFISSSLSVSSASSSGSSHWVSSRMMIGDFSLGDISAFSNITHIEPKEVNNFFTVTNKKIDTLEDSINDLSKYTTKLNTIEEIVNSKVRENSPPYSPYNLDDLTSRIASLESLCTQLNTKRDSMSNRYPYQVQSASNHPALSQTITPSAPSHLRNAPAPSPKTCIILGDSNTKYVKLEDSHLDSLKVPTYVIDDIDPSSCIGYKKIWIHVGINNLKTLNCKNINDIHGHFNTLIQKLKAIRSLCPYSKLMVSPILPTAIPILNKRALIFNELLFAQSNWFTTLDFNLFCGNDGNLVDIYRCYNNRQDRIHLGSLGI